MIRLDVEDYCSDCPDFDPKKEVLGYFSGDEVIERHTTVYCNYRDRCAAIAKHLEEANKKEAEG